jgi:AcrR family transcriptional regulator
LTEADLAGPRRGRPPTTSRRELQVIALRMFTERGFETTTIEQIAAEAGVSERTFFRYFTTKASVLWSEFETEVQTIRSGAGSASRPARCTRSPSGAPPSPPAGRPMTAGRSGPTAT